MMVRVERQYTTVGGSFLIVASETARKTDTAHSPYAERLEKQTSRSSWRQAQVKRHWNIT